MGDHRYSLRHFATLQTGSLCASGRPICVQQGPHGDDMAGRKATTNTDFWPKWLFPQQEGCQPGLAGLSPGCSKGPDVLLVVEGWVVCSVSLLSRFLEDRRDLSELGSVKQSSTCSYRFREVPFQLNPPAGW